MHTFKLCALVVSCAAVCGCGTTLPQLDLVHPVDVQANYNPDFDAFVRRIANHVVCEVAFAADSMYISSPLDRHHILKDWAAKVELDINAMETGDLNPGLSYFTKNSAFVFGINGKIESQAVNNASLTYYIPFNQVMSPEPHTSDRVWEYGCDQPSSSFHEPIEGTLGIQSILEAGLRLYDEPGFVGQRLKSGPFDTISKTVSFQVTTSGNLNPAWKLTNVSLVTPGPLAQAARVSMNKLVISMGPSTLGTHTEILPGKKGAAVVRSVPLGSSPLDESFFLERLKGVMLTRSTGLY